MKLLRCCCCLWHLCFLWSSTKVGRSLKKNKYDILRYLVNTIYIINFEVMYMSCIHMYVWYFVHIHVHYQVVVHYIRYFSFYYFFLETFERLLLNALMKTLISIIIFLTTKIIAQQVPVSLASLYYISNSLFTDFILLLFFFFAHSISIQPHNQ